MTLDAKWFAVSKADPRARALADRHYSRQKPGTPQFCRPGQNIVLLTQDGRALWVSWRPKPGIQRMDGLDAIECTMFRNEGPYLSSDLIREAVELTLAKWGRPKDGLLTYIAHEKVRSSNPGCCFKKAGWRRDGTYSRGNGLVRLRL